MADQKISAMTAALSIGASDLVPIVQGGANKSLTGAALFLSFGGWIPDTYTWTYVSANTNTINTDATGWITPGTKVKFTQVATVKYFNVVSASYAGGLTTVTYATSSDYTIANSAISSPYFSYQVNPQGWPNWFNWTPTLTGFSVAPAGANYQFQIVNGTVFWNFDEGTTGTSDGTTAFTATPPVACMAGLAFAGVNGVAVDNNVQLTVPSRWVLSASLITFYTNMSTGAWTAGGLKRVRAAGFYRAF